MFLNFPFNQVGQEDKSSFGNVCDALRQVAESVPASFKSPEQVVTELLGEVSHLYTNLNEIPDKDW